MTNLQAISDVLTKISISIEIFVNTKAYHLLADMPADLSLKQFIVAKDNGCRLAGTQSLFRSCEVIADFTLPAKFAKPAKPAKPEAFTGKAKNDYYELLEVWSDWDLTPEATMNAEIDLSATRILRDDLIRKGRNLQRCIAFVRSFDASMFETNEELDLHELSESTRQKILSVYRSAFTANPNLLLQGSAVDLLAKDQLCNLDSVEGIDRIITIKNAYPSAAYGFINRELLGLALHSVREECNGLTLLRIASRLDTHLGGSKNATSILANLRMLVSGLAPSKGKKAAAQ